MAPSGSCLCCSLCHNLFFVDYIEDELTRDQAPPKRSNFNSISSGLALSHDLTLVPTLVLTPAPALPALDKLFKQLMKSYLESNQRSS